MPAEGDAAGRGRHDDDERAAREAWHRAIRGPLHAWDTPTIVRPVLYFADYCSGRLWNVGDPHVSL